jgi:GNAT superfamily N-acetyltransferase
MIRRATKRDIPLIAKIEINSGYEFRDSEDLNKWIKIIEKYFDSGRIYFLYGDKAYCSLNFIGKKCEFEFLSVLKKFHGKGIGKNLVLHREKFAKRKGCKKVFVEINNKNFPMISVYNSLGYSIVSIKDKINYGKKVKKLIMEKSFSNN